MTDRLTNRLMDIPNYIKPALRGFNSNKISMCDNQPAYIKICSDYMPECDT